MIHHSSNPSKCLETILLRHISILDSLIEKDLKYCLSSPKLYENELYFRQLA
jgi:hypothetical protein